MSVSTSWIISGIVSVAFGYTSASSMRRYFRSAWKMSTIGEVTSVIVLPVWLARVMILSSTSVRFMICRTCHPRSRSVRRRRSSNRNVRKFPRCAGLYTVGPHVYINTVIPFAGAKAPSFA